MSTTLTDLAVAEARLGAEALSDPRVAVIVLNWNGWADTISCLESLLELHQDVDIFLCDNASSDASVAHFCAWADRVLPVLNERRGAQGRGAVLFRQGDSAPSIPFPAERAVAITVLETGGNLGFAGGNNVGLKRALAGPYGFFWVLNNDTCVLPDSLDWALRRMRETPNAGMCGSTLVFMDEPDLVQCLGGGTFSTLKGRGAQIGEKSAYSDAIDGAAVEKRMRYVSGAAMLVSRAFVEQVGLMHEDYFLYYEELDWAARGRGRFALVYAPRSKILHRVGASIGTNDRGERSPLSDYHLMRSRVRFCWRLSKLSFPFMTIDVLRITAGWLIKRRWRRAALILRAAVGLPFTSADARS